MTLDYGAICFALAGICFILGTIFERRTIREINRVIDPPLTAITTICCECHAHISGPRVMLGGREHPSYPSYPSHPPISHGLCQECAQRWKDSMLTDSWPHQT